MRTLRGLALLVVMGCGTGRFCTPETCSACCDAADRCGACAGGGGTGGGQALRGPPYLYSCVNTLRCGTQDPFVNVGGDHCASSAIAAASAEKQTGCGSPNCSCTPHCSQTSSALCR